MGISSDFLPADQAWGEKMGLTFPLVSDFARTTLDAYGFLDTDPKSRLYR
jgi:peroxiredoxin